MKTEMSVTNIFNSFEFLIVHLYNLFLATNENRDVGYKYF